MLHYTQAHCLLNLTSREEKVHFAITAIANNRPYTTSLCHCELYLQSSLQAVNIDRILSEFKKYVCLRVRYMTAQFPFRTDGLVQWFQ